VTEPRADADPIPDLVALVEQLDEENERLRVKVLDLLRMMEETVDSQVAGERRIAELERRILSLEADLAAINQSFVVRVTAPLRRLVVGLRRRSG
jgi:hypothetical protein